MASEKPSVACTIRGARQFGRMVPQHQAAGARTGDTARHHVVLALLGDDRGAGEARVVRHVDDGDGDDGVGQPWPQDRHDHDRQEQARDRQEHVQRGRMITVSAQPR